MTQKTLIIVLVGIIAILWSTVFFVKETERAMGICLVAAPVRSNRTARSQSQRPKTTHRRTPYAPPTALRLSLIHI